MSEPKPDILPRVDITSSRAVTALVGGASEIVLIVGLRYFADIIGPLFLALVLTVAVHPLRVRLTRGRLPRWVGTVVSLLCVFGLLLALSLAVVAAGAQLVSLLGDYASQFDQSRENVAGALPPAGARGTGSRDVVSSFDTGKLSGFIVKLLGGAAGLASNIVLILGLLLFMGLDAGGYTGVLGHMPAARRPL